MFGDNGAHGGMQNHDESKGVIVMGANCLIRMINDVSPRASTLQSSWPHPWQGATQHTDAWSHPVPLAQAAINMFGYASKAELVGKNINLIVPPPFSRNHNNYVRNYIQTGEARERHAACEGGPERVTPRQ